MFTFHFNKYEERDKRRKLRNNPTEVEKILWQFLRKKQILGYKFRRQHGIDAFVVDFYCPRVRLAIEIDGGIHRSGGVKNYDIDRQRYLEQFGISFLRFSNEEVLNNTENVLSVIKAKLKELENSKVSITH